MIAAINQFGNSATSETITIVTPGLRKFSLRNSLLRHIIWYNYVVIVRIILYMYNIILNRYVPRNISLLSEM